MILLHVLRMKYRVSPATLVKRLSELEHQLLTPPSKAESPSLETTLLQKVKDKIASTPIEEAPITPQEPPPIKPAAPSHRHDTILRFAAIELEGILKK